MQKSKFSGYFLPKWMSDIFKDKTGVINDPLGQTHSHASSDHCFLLFCFARFEKWGWTDGQHVQKQLSLPAVVVGWPSGSIYMSTIPHVIIYESWWNVQVSLPKISLELKCTNHRMSVIYPAAFWSTKPYFTFFKHFVRPSPQISHNKTNFKLK